MKKTKKYLGLILADGRDNFLHLSSNYRGSLHSLTTVTIK